MFLYCVRYGSNFISLNYSSETNMGEVVYLEYNPKAGKGNILKISQERVTSHLGFYIKQCPPEK